MNEWWLITRKRQRKGEYTGTLDKPRKVGCGNTINTHISVDTTYSLNTGSSYSIALSEGMSQQKADREVQPRHVGPPGVELELLKRAKVHTAREDKANQHEECAQLLYDGNTLKTNHKHSHSFTLTSLVTQRLIGIAYKLSFYCNKYNMNPSHLSNNKNDNNVLKIC